MEETLATSLLNGYKRVNRVLAVALFVCLGIICLFVGGLIYVVCNYDFEYTSVDTNDGNAIYNEVGDINAKSSSQHND